MQIYQHWQGLQPADRGASVAMGNFDGVHLGHHARSLTLRAMMPRWASSRSSRIPREYFAPNAPAFRLMNAEARANRLAKLGVERLYELPFNAEMVAPHARGVCQTGAGRWPGHPPCRGRRRFLLWQRAARARLLTCRPLGAKHGFAVTIADLIRHDGPRHLLDRDPHRP